MFKLKSLILAAAVGFIPAVASDLVILTTNDTHSNIDPSADGIGGILPRKAIIDSVRHAEKNVLLVDAGDMVQGTLYFKYFGGDVEYPLFNMMDYDVRILGNHEFDNGLDELAKHWKTVKGARLSANYDFKGTSADGIFEPYVIKKVDGKKIGIFGLNVDPESLISKENYPGMKFYPVIETANKTAAYLKDKKKCDLVVAVTHIGYDNENGKTTDVDLAKASKDIDIIIGGHSHSFVDPSTPEKTPHWIDNAEGRPVLVTQTGKYGRNVGYIKVDLDKLADRDHTDDFDYEYIPVTARFPEEKYDKRMEAFLAPYRHKVDSVNSLVIGESLYDMTNQSRVGGLANFTADMAMNISKSIAAAERAADHDFPEVDMAVMNVGGIRQEMPKGHITEGQILSTYPFSNRLNLVKIKGKDIIEAMKVAAMKGGESISDNVRVLVNGPELYDVIIDGEPMDPEREYNLMTIDYLAGGNDDLTSLANHELIWTDSYEISKRMLDYIRHLTDLGLPVAPDQTPRFLERVSRMEL